MQKTKYFTRVYHSALFFCSKRREIKFETLFDYENQQENRITKNIGTDHSADIDYKDFVKIYRECTEKTCFFLTVDTTLPASDPLRFRKKILTSYKNDSN